MSKWVNNGNSWVNLYKNVANTIARHYTMEESGVLRAKWGKEETRIISSISILDFGKSCPKAESAKDTGSITQDSTKDNSTLLK